MRGLFHCLFALVTFPLLTAASAFSQGPGGGGGVSAEGPSISLLDITSESGQNPQVGDIFHLCGTTRGIPNGDTIKIQRTLFIKDGNGQIVGEVPGLSDIVVTVTASPDPANPSATGAGSFFVSASWTIAASQAYLLVATHVESGIYTDQKSGDVGP